MPIKIVDADYSQLKLVKRAGRARSKDTLDLIKAIEELGPGKAKALIIERGDSAARLRAKVSNAAKIVGVKVRVFIAENKVIFGLRRGKSGGAKAGAAARKESVRQKALQLAKGGRKSITAADVLKALETDGARISTARPATMVGAVLRNMGEFERAGKNTFKYRG